MITSKTISKVILAGAGPGDPELITLKALRYLQQADVVITDRLVSEELITRYARPDAKIIYVGKQAGQKKSTSQSAINELLVEYALQYPLVLRLKGGDIAFFSNVLDELRTLNENGISYEIVPGITSASGASAYAGIPLTARGYATAVRFLTLSAAELNWTDLASTDDTLVFYMSSEGLDQLVQNLREHGVNGDKQLAVIEQATTPSQRVRVASLDEYNDTLKGKEWSSPTLVIIGWVAGLHEEFKWIGNKEGYENYFPSVDQTVDKQARIVC